MSATPRSTIDPPDETQPRKGLTAQAVRSVAVTALSFGGNKLLVFISTVVLARLLTPKDFGVVAAASAVILYFDVVLDLGIGAALIYEQEDGTTERVQTAFTLNVIVTSALTAIGLLATPALAAFFSLQADENVFRALFVYLFIKGLGQVQDSMLQRDMRFGRRGSVEIARGVVRAGVSIGMAVSGFGVWALVGGLLAGEVTATTLSWALVRFRPHFTLDRAVVRAIMGFGLAFIALKISDAIALDSDYLVVGHALGPTQLGYYTIAYRLPEVALTSLYWIFGTVAFPLYAQARARGQDVTGYVQVRALRLIAIFSFPAGVLLALLSRDVIFVLFGTRWAPAVTPMVLISLTTAVASVGFSSGDLFPAMGRPATLLVINAPMTVVLVISYILVVPYGIIAIAAAHLVMSFVAQGSRLLLVSKVFGTKVAQQLRALWPGTCAMLGVLALAGPVRLLMPQGALSLVLMSLAGVLGAFGGLYAGARGSFDELRTLAGALRLRAAA
jgi:lipopolysaccharide exporter